MGPITAIAAATGGTLLEKAVEAAVVSGAGALGTEVATDLYDGVKEGVSNTWEAIEDWFS